ncbi:hypothetical protein [Alloactinosynnema sp. L-07]|uniref:hypothetical protein n=1 Tax=Alloactinosynnema sp. L-07 TaxID=1653480 RepID=UPI00065EF106|nr:hypothetical protein [Alloactinosynnema sp. L-07]CRK60597.1 hypothetical protein [Alloactinosynnema sp. L-07]
MTAPSSKFVLDAMCLNHFARIDRLDVLRDLLVADQCYTTYVVLNEIKDGVHTHPLLASALEMDWVRPRRLDSISELDCFAKWIERVGAARRNQGEASVFAAAELLGGIAITDDGDARKVASKFGLAVHGTIWLLARACNDSKLTPVAAGNLVDMLQASGMRLPCTGAEFPSWCHERGLIQLSPE